MGDAKGMHGAGAPGSAGAAEDDGGIGMLVRGCERVREEVERIRQKAKEEEESGVQDAEGASASAERIAELSRYLIEVLDVVEARYECDAAAAELADQEIQRLERLASAHRIEMACLRGIASMAGEIGEEPAGRRHLRGEGGGGDGAAAQEFEWEGLATGRTRLDRLFGRCALWITSPRRIDEAEASGGSWQEEGRGLERELGLEMGRVTSETARWIEACEAASRVLEVRSRAGQGASWAEAVAARPGEVGEGVLKRKY